MDPRRLGAGRALLPPRPPRLHPHDPAQLEKQFGRA